MSASPRQPMNQKNNPSSRHPQREFAGAKVLLFFELCKFFCKKLSKLHKIGKKEKSRYR